MKHFKTLLVPILFSFVAHSQNMLVNAGFDDVSKTVPNPKGYCHTVANNHYADATPANH